MSTQIDLPIAGGTVRAAGELVRRYCGMTGETWAYPFYDAVPTSPVVGPVDLLAAGIMHGPIRQEDLEWFVQVRDGMQRLVDALPDDTGLDDADDATVDTLTSGVLDLGDGRPPSLLTKIIHRHRPRLIVLDERDIGRRYGSAIDGRGRLPYPRLVHAVREDMRQPAVREGLEAIGRELRGLLPVPSRLRILDIAVWMDARR
ncbi:MAG: DUF6308 family protein [Actinomycetota bacterium]